MGTQKEGEARQTAIGTIFSAMLQRKSREFPSVEEFLKTIGMSFATYSQLLRGLGYPTAHTITRTAWLWDCPDGKCLAWTKRSCGAGLPVKTSILGK